MTLAARTVSAHPSEGLQLPLAGWPSDPDWLAVARRGAAAWVTANGFPSAKHEDWRYTRIDPALAIPFATDTDTGRRTATGGSWPDVSLRDLLGPGLGGIRLVVVDGHFAPELSDHGYLPSGARLDSLHDALAVAPHRLEPLWSWHPDGYPHALRALSDALATDGILIDLPTEAVVDDPIEIVLLTVPGRAPHWSHPRIVVLAGAGSKATVVETHLGVPGQPSVTNALTQVVVDDGAQVAHYVIQDENLDSFHFSSLDAHLGHSSRFSSRLLAVGGRIGRHEVHTVLHGENAEVELHGLFLTGSGQHHDNAILVDHAALGCRSHQIYKGVIDGDGHGVFNGHIVVRPGAVGTDAHQTNKNLLLSDRAEVDTRPRLEIFADDVACTHGAAVGQLDPDALFYLRSRGVPHQEARALLVSGFVQEVLDCFADGPIRQYAERLVAAHLEPIMSAGRRGTDSASDSDSDSARDVSASRSRGGTAK